MESMDELTTNNSFGEKSGIVQAEKVIFEAHEVALESDNLDIIRRKAIMAAHYFGLNKIKEISLFSGIDSKKVRELIEDHQSWLYKATQNGMIACFSKAEIIARLCMEAENALASKDRLTALTKIMEFRGYTAPEGGAKSFSRIAMRFVK